MIELLQHKVPSSTMEAPYNKMDEITIHLNKGIIEKDLERLRTLAEKPTNKYDKANINYLISYLQKLMKNINSESEFDMCWEIRDGLPYTYPLNLINERAYGIDICNYVELSENEKLIHMNMKDLDDIIAFEFMARDLGETHESIEELLKNCGIIGFEPASLLTDFFKKNGDNVYELSKSMKIEKTPYYSYENRKVHDYFSSKEFKTKEYREVVEYSCKYANTIIANTLIKNATHRGETKLIMLNATDIALIVSVDSDEEIKQKILEEISIRSFGRRFKIEPCIQIF